jgi:hypothetical protein
MTAPTSRQVQELAAAVRDALDVPHPARRDDERYTDLLRTRIAAVRGALARVAAGTAFDGDHVAGAAKAIRDMTAESPVTYTPYKPEVEW